MAALHWDETGERYLETGTRRGVLYLYDKSTGTYGNGVAWNGLTAVTESPDGAEDNDLYADDIKYASLKSTETFGFTIEAYTYPVEFEQCDGMARFADGVIAGQQSRQIFGFSYRTKVTNDLGDNYYKLHLIYGASASPSERSYETINDSPDAITFSWECTTTPATVSIDGYSPVSLITIDSRDADPDKLKELEEILYGGSDYSGPPVSENVLTVSEDAAPRLPLPDEVYSLFNSDDSDEEDID